MSYTVKHTSSRDALIEFIRFVGGRRFRLLARAVRGGTYGDEQIRFLCSFAGVQWYPVDCLLARYRRGAASGCVGDMGQAIYNFSK